MNKSTTTKKDNTVTMYATCDYTKVSFDNADNCNYYKDTATALKGASDGDTLYIVTFQKVADVKLQLVASKEVTQ